VIQAFKTLPLDWQENLYAERDDKSAELDEIEDLRAAAPKLEKVI